MLDFHPDPLPPSSAEDELRALLERARLGEAAVVPALRAALDEHPEVWDQFGNLAAHAQQSWIELISGPDLALAEILTRKTAALEVELAGPNPTPLESLLAARIVANWLQVHQADAAQAQSGEVSLKHAEFTSKRQSRAHKSYLMAIAALATIRRLLPAAPRQTAEESPALGSRQSSPAGPDPAAREVGDDHRPGATAGPGPLALFDRSGSVSGRGDGPGGHRGVRAS